MSNEQGNYYSVFGVDNSTLIPFTDFYDTMHFGGDSKIYKELVYTSRIKDTLNLAIEVLTNESKTSRLALRNDRKKVKGEEIEIPRPQNAWIIYRRDKYVSPEFEGIKPCIASKTIGKRWKKESNEVLEYFVALSMLALENHHNKYGNYKYKPKSKASKKIKNRQRQQSKRNTTEETTLLNQDLPQLVVNPPSPYPTPVSSIQHSPVTDFSEQANENSYLMTPAPSNHQSPVTSQYGSSDIFTPESLNQQTPITTEDILSLMNSDPISMYPQLSEITPTNDFSTYNNNSLPFSEYVLKFLNNADILASLQSLTDVTYNTDIPDMTYNTDIPATPAPFDVDIPATPTPAPVMTFNDMTFGVDIAPDNTDIPATLDTLPKIIFNSITNTNDQIQDFDLYSDNEESEGLIISDITPPAAEPITTSMENQIFQEIFEYDSYDLFSIHATPPVDQFNYYDNTNGPSF